MTRVVHVSSAHPWNDNRIHFREATSLAHAGYDVTLVAVATADAPPPGDVRVRTLPRLRRTWRVLFSAPRAVAMALSTRARIVHLHDPELIWAIPLLRVLGRTVVYDAHEDLPVQVLDKPYTNAVTRPILVGAARALCWLAGTSTAVIAATEQVASRFPSSKTTVVRNFPPLLENEATAPAVESRDPLMVYIGAIGRARGADVMVEAMAHPDMPQGWMLRLAGSMPAQLHERLAANPGWEKVEYLGVLPPQEARELLLSARIGFAVLQATPAYVDALPTKMFEYFAAGVPVIASDFPLWRDIIDRHECGQVVDQRDPAAIARAVRRYADDPALLAQHGANARRAAVESLNWASEAKQLIQAYSALPDRGARRS
ncbi:glycosyltransferase family 4 protein [Microbacterium sp. LWH12-1.2]|uniref:glycosyltransferase family 4 protein n=1 Tax=Microbacterium sp. LWH12-1.2 TaxID=3135259 RepID=UPI003429652F